jgi:solute carrier family 31 (copper transporter), member 1
MLWNWHTFGACFLSPSWKIRSNGGFAGLCIGVFLAAVLLQTLSWASRFYDKRLVRQHQFQAVALATQAVHNAGTNDYLTAKNAHGVSPMATFRPNLMQQTVRTLIRTLRFVLSYWIMLLAVHYNGYVIISIILGTFVRIYVFQWERMGGPHGVVPGGYADPTGCCG